MTIALEEGEKKTWNRRLYSWQTVQTSKVSLRTHTSQGREYWRDERAIQLAWSWDTNFWEQHWAVYPRLLELELNTESLSNGTGKSHPQIGAWLFLFFLPPCAYLDMLPRCLPTNKSYVHLYSSLECLGRDNGLSPVPGDQYSRRYSFK